MTAKATLRETVLRRRDALPPEERAALSARIISSVLRLGAYRRSDAVLAYASFGSELRTDDLLRRTLADGKTLVLPRVEDGGLKLYEVRDVDRDLVPGTWGIREPVTENCPVADPGGLDFALIPGVAFDRRGRRLGYGGGFYDRLISSYLQEGTPLVAGAFEVQMVEEVPVGPGDVPVDAVVTEGRVYRREGSSGET